MPPSYFKYQTNNGCLPKPTAESRPKGGIFYLLTKFKNKEVKNSPLKK
jgi:hypothetical protein